jgi:hypothetical protein
MFNHPGKRRVTALALFCDLTVTPERSSGCHIEITSPYARRTPLFAHPAFIKNLRPGTDILEAMVNSSDEIQIITDPAWPSRNAPEHPTKDNKTEKIGGRGVDEGQWTNLLPAPGGLTTTFSSRDSGPSLQT